MRPRARVCLALLLSAWFPLWAAADDVTDLVAVARSLIESGNLDGAGQMLEGVVKEHPDDARLHMLLGVVYRQRLPARPDDAAKEMATALRLAPNLSGAMSLLVDLLEELDRGAEARRLLRVRLEQEPGDFEALRLLGALLLEEGSALEGEVLLRQALQANPQDGESWLVLGKAHLRSGEPEPAVESLEHARELLPGSPQVRYSLAQAYQGIGRTQDGRAELKVYQELQRQKQHAREEGRSHGLMMHAIAVHEERLLDDADRSAGEYRYLAGLYHIGGTGDRGREFFRRLAREQDALALPLLGEALLERRFGRGQRAWELLLKALERRPEDPVILTAMTKLVTPTRGQELHELLTVMGTRRDPPDKLSLWLGAVAMNSGRLEEAQRWFELARQTTPDDPEVLLNLGVLHARQDQVIPALGLFRLLTESYPNNGPGWYNRALVEMRLGQSADASVHLQKALDAGEVRPRVLNLLAQLLARQGRKERAVDLLQQSLAFQGNQPRVHLLLEQLQRAADGS